MIVYATSLWLSSASEEEARSASLEWLSRKTRREISREALLGRYTPLGGGSDLESWSLPGNQAGIQSWRYRHPDSETRGRSWTTEFGLRREENGELKITVLLRTEEISSRVSVPIQVSRPRLITELARRCKILPRTPGTHVKMVKNEHSAEAFRFSVEDSLRRHPLVVVSPTQDGRYLVVPEQLSELLLGLADVVTISPNADSFRVADILGSRYSAWRGAVNVLYPPVQGETPIVVPNRRLMPEDLLQPSGATAEAEVFGLVAHITNERLARAHISPDLVKSALVRQQLEELRQSTASEGLDREYVALLESELNRVDAEAKALRERLEASEQIRDALSIQRDEDQRQERFEIGQLRQALEKAKGQPGVATADSQVLAKSARMVLERRATLVDGLTVLASAFGERVEILDTAWRSARDAEDFEEPTRAVELMIKLATSYWESIANGKGDADARGIFGEAYAARESESVGNNKRARALRRFTYEGQDVLMASHLKIGVKTSSARTWRLHFLWDASRKKIVIGHCGRHLDHD